MRLLVFALGSMGLLAFSASALAQDAIGPLLEEPVRAQPEDRIPALVQDCTAPCAGYDVSAELQNDWIFAADPSFLKSDVLQPTLTVDLFFAPTNYLQFVTSIVTEPAVDPEPGQNAVFQGIGTFVEELYGLAEAGPVGAKAGKFNTIFSLASEVLPGINSTNLVSNIDADERMGAETVLVFDGFGLNHALAATAFTTDRTVLSESLFTNRGRTTLSDGGVGNTTGISSFSLVLNGCKGWETPDCYTDGEFGYRLGFRYQKAGETAGLPPDEIPEEEEFEEEPAAGNEMAYLAAATGSFDLDGKTLRLLGETTYLQHFEGGADDALVLTGSAALEVESLTYIAAYTQQLNFVAEGPNTREHLADFEILYQSAEDRPFNGAQWTLGAAYTFAQNADNERAHTFSVRATLDFGGNVEFHR